MLWTTELFEDLRPKAKDQIGNRQSQIGNDPIASRKNPLEMGFVASPKNPLQM
jgi:hypothetical protein